MEDDTVIKVQNLSKKFARSLKRSMAYGTIDMARDFLGVGGERGRLRKGEFWALEDINFEIKKGEAVGIIGINGSGKSTLLRLLSGIYPPDKGTITIKGNIGSLIAVGAGFHPHMSGRENIFLNGTILGMSSKEISEKFDEIVNFADIGDFLDAPVSTYSSGMRVRLGFAIAIHCKPDILLVDEILSVGDLSFRNKSLRYMSEFRKQANALVFVSHDLEQIRNVCSRIIILGKGKVLFDGNPVEGVIKYQELTRETRQEYLNADNTAAEKSVDGYGDFNEVKLLDTGILNSKGVKSTEIKVDEPFTHYIDVEVMNDIDELLFSSGIFDEKNTQVIWILSNDLNKFKFENISRGKYRISAYYKEHHLMPGVYSISHGIRNPRTFETFQRITNSGTFKVTSKTIMERGIIQTDYEWRLEKI